MHEGGRFGRPFLWNSPQPPEYESPVEPGRFSRLPVTLNAGRTGAGAGM